MARRTGTFALFASFAGVFAALSAVFSKLAGEVDHSKWVLQLLLYALMVVANLANVALFSASLRTTTSLRAAATSVGTNIVASGVLGILLFDETVSLRWVWGVVLTLLGMALVHPSNTVRKHRRD